MNKYLSFILCICLISACSNNDDDSICNARDTNFTKDYKKEFQIRIGESVCFPGGNSFEIIEINDEFCCCLCLCTWEGELEILVETTNLEEEKELLSFGSTTYNLNNNIFENYIVSKIDYQYKNEPNSLPLCEGTYDHAEVELTFKISPK